MLEITKEHIKKLNDADLRILVGKQYESELKNHNLSTNYVLYGGNQRAKDGGTDVKVVVPPAEFATSNSGRVCPTRNNVQKVYQKNRRKDSII